MQLRQIKADFREMLVTTGENTLKPTGNEKADFYLPRWYKQFVEPPEATFPGSPRLINHFKLGADPEFILWVPGKTEQVASPLTGALGREIEHKPYRMNASNIPLLTGLFVGADQNGRLVEVRPAPSRFALRVLASILASLRWAVVLKPELLEYEWKSGAFLEGDGLGGHIHFGRKSCTRPEEIVGLDAIAATLKRTSAFPTHQWDKRMSGDERNQQYGKFTDYRLQSHGYEYRTLPSWLDSPWTAYLSLVVSKLAVYNPELVTTWFQDTTVKENGIRNLLAYYKELDDDARIAYLALLKHGMPVYRGKDIRAAWGLLYPTLYKSDVEIWPQSIKPAPQELADCFKFLVEGVALKPTQPECNWVAKVPQDFLSLRWPKTTMGMGELTWDLVTHRNLKVLLDPDTPGYGTTVIKTPLKVPGLAKAMRSLDQPYSVSRADSDFWIYVPRSIRKSPEKLGALKKVLTAFLPIWSYKNIPPDYSKWFGVKARQYKTKLIEEY